MVGKHKHRNQKGSKNIKGNNTKKRNQAEVTIKQQHKDGNINGGKKQKACNIA
jgi:hypothetical protein